MRETTSPQPAHRPTNWPELGTAFETHPMPVEEVHEDGRLVIRAELPGVDVEHDLSVDVRDHMLEIRASRTQGYTNHNGARRSEFHYGRFWRVLTLPHSARVADIEASYRDGILEVRVPVTAADPTVGRHIAVKRG